MNFIEQNKLSYNKISAEFSATRAYNWSDAKLLLEFVKENDSILDVGCGNGRLIEDLKSKIKNFTYLGIDNSDGLIAEAQKKNPDYKFEVLDILNINIEKEFHTEPEEHCHPEVRSEAQPRRRHECLLSALGLSVSETEIFKNEFDVVFAISSLNHLPQEKHQAFINNVSSLLKPGGYLLMINWNLWNIYRKKSFWRLGFRRYLKTTWSSRGVSAPLYYYAFTKNELKSLLQNNGFAVIRNLYSQKGTTSSWCNGDNLITVARKNQP